jgi:ketosteroid isomerase-like protein
MRTLILFVTLAVAASVAAAQRPTTKRPGTRAKAAATAEQRRASSEAEDQHAIEQLHQDEIVANLAFDVDKLTNTWDDDVVAMPPGSKPIVGKAANHEHLDSQQKAMANVEILGYEETWDEVRILGDYAYEYGTIRSRIREANAKDETLLEYNVMRVLKKEPSGAWKVYRTIWNDRKGAEGSKAVDK